MNNIICSKVVENGQPKALQGSFLQTNFAENSISMTQIYLPYYMRRKRKNLTREQILQADTIRQHLTAIAKQDGYGVTYYTDSAGRAMANIGRADGKGMGFTITAAQAHEWLQDTE